MTIDDLERVLKYHQFVRGAFVALFIDSEIKRAWEKVGFELETWHRLEMDRLKSLAHKEVVRAANRTPSAEKSAKQSETMKRLWAEKRAKANNDKKA